MPRYSPEGKRLVSRPARYPVPAGLLRDIDAEAVRVRKLRRDRDDIRHKVRWYDEQASQACSRADTAVNPGLRKAEYERASRLRALGADMRVRLGKTERALAGFEETLRGLHRTAGQYQRGELEEDQEEA
jgi:hypothetical protein